MCEGTLATNKERKRVRMKLKKTIVSAIANRKRGLAVCLTIVVVLSTAIPLLMLFPSAEPFGRNQALLVGVFLMLVLCIAMLAFCATADSARAHKVFAQVEERAPLLGIVATALFGAVVTSAISFGSLATAQSQLEFENHSAYPVFSLVDKRGGEQHDFTLSSFVGSASNVSLTVIDRCYFRYENTPCLLDIYQTTELTDGAGSIDFQNRSVSFSPECRYTEKDEASTLATEYILSVLPEAETISVERWYEVSFFDYQGENATHHFSCRDGALRLTSTTQHWHPENNAGSTVFDSLPYETALEFALDYLLERFEPLAE